MNINLITQSEFDTAMEALEYLRTCAMNLTSSYDLSLISRVINDRVNVLNLIRSVPKKRIELDCLKEEKMDLEKELTIFQSKRQIADGLRNRPSDCSIDTCPYIKSAVEADAQYPSGKMIEISNSLENVTIQSQSIARDLEEAELLSDVLTAVTTIERELESKMKFIQKLPVRPDFKQTFLQRVVDLDSFSDIDALYKYVDCGNMIEEYKVAKEQLKTYKMEYRLYESKNEIIETIINDIESLSKKTNELANDINTYNDSIYSKEQELAEKKKSMDDIESMLSIISNTYVPAQTKQQGLISTKNSLDGYTSELNSLQDELSKLNTNLAGVNNDIKVLTDERDAIRHSLILLDDYQRELKEYSDKYTKIEKIRYYSSSSTGIQTVFMSLYMNNIIRNANDLLGLLFDGEFALQPFIINESEFRIPCLGSGLLHDDISSMSTAQKSMISMILSFSILNQSATRYNIIRLDELDGGLDTSNRGYFITLLDRLMGMLRCEQAFIISHNNELDSSAADIIILKNSSHESYTGNIIWKY
jgi:predicted  nucleic acid-binding Zn-ribbon protein